MRLFISPLDLEHSAELQRSYLDQQAKLWQALVAGEKAALVEDDDRRFASREWRDAAGKCGRRPHTVRLRPRILNLSSRV